MLNKGEYQKLARYELTLTDIAEDDIFYNIQNADNYQITLEDLLCVLKKIYLRAPNMKKRTIFFITETLF